MALVPACSSDDDAKTAPADCESSVSIDGGLDGEDARLEAFESCMEDRGWDCETGAGGSSGCQRLTNENEEGPADDEYEYVVNPFDLSAP